MSVKGQTLTVEVSVIFTKYKPLFYFNARLMGLYRIKHNPKSYPTDGVPALIYNPAFHFRQRTEKIAIAIFLLRVMSN